MGFEPTARRYFAEPKDAVNMIALLASHRTRCVNGDDFR